MTNLEDAVCEQIGKKISDYSKLDTLSAFASLLTIPCYSANTIRIEKLVQLSVVHCNGSKKVPQDLINDVVNVIMGNTFIAKSEVLTKDVFISNILTKFGDYRVFNSVLEANDYFIQTIIDVIDKKPEFDVLQNVSDNIYALLKISDEIANRAKLSRNCWELSEPNENLKLPSTQKLLKYAKRVIFSKDDLAEIGVVPEQLKPFIFSVEDVHSLSCSSLRNTRLERQPIVLIDGLYVISLPGAIGVALRRYLLEECRANGLLEFFQDTLKSYQEYQLTHEILKEYRNDAEFIELDAQKIKNLPSMYSVSTKDDSNRYVHAMLFHDDLSKIIDEGMDSRYQHTKDELYAIRKYFSVVAKNCTNQNGFTGGQFLCSIGGLGRGHLINFDDWPSRWNLSVVTLNDLLLLSRTKSKPLSELFLCLSQKSWCEDCGVEFLNINGDINYYGYWRANDYKCIPDDLSITKGRVIIPPTDYVFALRRNLRIATDRHSALVCTDKWVKVERLEKNPLFESLKHHPVYVSIDHRGDGYLNAVIESDFANIWFGLLTETNNISANIIDWWSGFVHLLAKFVLIIDNQINTRRKYNIQLRLNISNLKLPNNELESRAENHNITTNIRGNVVDINLSKNYLLIFTKEVNLGEREILKALANSISCVLATHHICIEPYIESALELVVGDPGVRVIHITSTLDRAEHLFLEKLGDVKFCDIKRSIFDNIRIVYPSNFYRQIFNDKETCRVVLHDIVDKVWIEIKRKLSATNKIELLTKLSDQLILSQNDRFQWERASKSIQAIYGKDDVVELARSRDLNGNLTVICLRVLFEMASAESMCETRVSHSDDLLDELLSLCSVLVKTATHSDAIHSGLIEPIIRFYSNGLYQHCGNVSTDVVKYYNRHFEREFLKTIDSYKDLYSESENPQRPKPCGAYKKSFISAFEMETGLTLDVAIKIFTHLEHYMIEMSKTSAVIEINRIAAHFEKNLYICRDYFFQFLKYFALYPRKSWATVPPGYDNRDIMPSKHKRRLSCLVKPIVVLDNKFIFISLQTIKLGCSYFFHKASNGEFHSEFFRSDEMQSYVGEVTCEKGSVFNDQVYRHFLATGWEAHKQVEMTSLGAPCKLGDIDVLAFKDGSLLVIECKNLQIAKTISEIADICNRFKGVSNDELGRHLARVKWVRKNISKLQTRYEPENIQNLDHYLITATDLPIRFCNDLPIDPTKILFFGDLKDNPQVHRKR